MSSSNATLVGIACKGVETQSITAAFCAEGAPGMKHEE